MCTCIYMYINTYVYKRIWIYIYTFIYIKQATPEKEE